jgi:hypothetical protein
LAIATAIALSITLVPVSTTAAAATSARVGVKASDSDSLMTSTLVTISKTTSDAGFTHPGIGVTAANLINARTQVRGGAQPWKSYYDAMTQTSYASPTLTSKNGSAVLDQPGTDSFTNTGTESKLIQDSWGAYTQAILYFVTGNSVYRANAMKIIRIWSHMDPTKYAYYADSQIHTGVPLYRLLSAAEILRYTSYDADYTDYNLAWTDADTANLTTNLIDPMTSTFLYKNDYYFNQHSYPLVGALAGYIFTDNLDRYNQGVEWFTVNATTDRPEQNGAIAGIFKYVDTSNPLNTYGYPFVQHQEMTRDQAHSGGDVDTLTGLARIVSVQGTKVDPVKGTPSTAKNAVTPYRFLDNRILMGANAYAQFMLGHETPWVDLTGGTGTISSAYRGRLSDITEINEIYDVYKYEEGVNVEKVAPYVAKAHEQANGPLYYRGGSLTNFWGGIDTGPEFWLAFPSALKGHAPPPAGDQNVQFEQKSVPIAGHSAVKNDGDHSFVEVRASQQGSTIALHDLSYQDRSKYSPVGVMIRTNSTSTLEVSKDQDTPAFYTTTLPNTRGQWRYITYDMSTQAIPPNQTGDNIAFYTVVGNPRSTVDFDYVNVLAGTQLSPPLFPQGAATTVVTVASAALKTAFTAKDSNSADTVSYEGVGLPDGAQIDSATGAFTWTPSNSQVGQQTFQVVATDNTVDTVLSVTIDVAADRQSAYQETLTGYDPKQTYTSASLGDFTTVSDAVKASIPTATDDDFVASLVTLQAAVSSLEPLNAELADGSLNYPTMVTSNLSGDNVRNLVDGDYNTTSGDLHAPFIVDFGENFQVSATAFGLQARYMFANRSQGANVYGSNNAQDWTLLTSRETTDTTADNDAMETIPTLPALQTEEFRYFKVQVDDPGVPTDPAYPGLSSFSEFRIHGTRIELPPQPPLPPLTDYRSIASLDGATTFGRSVAPWEPKNPYTNALDGDPTTFYDGQGGGFVGVDAGAPVKLVGFAVIPRATYLSRMFGQVVQGSNDDATWDTLYTLPSSSIADNPAWTSFNFAARGMTEPATAYRYYRIYGATSTNIADVAFYTTAEVDFDALNAAVGAANALTKAGYTADSWAALARAVTSANHALTSDFTVQSTADAATSAVNTAIDALVRA